MNTTLGHSPLLIAEDEEDLARIGSMLLTTAARKTLDIQNDFNLVLSGGNTPRPLFKCLAGKHYRTIDWQRVRFFWSDERDVPPNHADSNFHMAEELLLKPLGIEADRIFRFRTELPSPQQVADDYESTLRRLFSSPQFDFSLLGLGEDGHTASLFPDAWQEWCDAEKNGRWVTSVWVPHLRSHRFTLLPRVLSASQKVLFLVSGSNKTGALKKVLDHDPSTQAELPAQLIRPAETALWLADRTAGASVRQAA